MFDQPISMTTAAVTDEMFHPHGSYVGMQEQTARGRVALWREPPADEDAGLKRCPRCSSAHTWLLGDGRYKCRSCRHRYSWRPIWDAIKLAEPARRALLHAFVGDDSAAAKEIAATARQRFYRLARACCALQNPVPHEALPIRDCQLQSAARSTMRGWASARQVMILSIVQHSGTVSICLPPVCPVHVLDLLRQRCALGGVLRVLDNLAYASLPVQGGYVSVPRVTHGVLTTHAVEDFWHYARRRLQEHRRIPLRQFPLYLGELCFRFNRRDEDLLPLVQGLLRSTAMSEVRPLLHAMDLQDSAAVVGPRRTEASSAEAPAHLPASRAESAGGGYPIRTHIYE
jgi:transposase